MQKADITVDLQEALQRLRHDIECSTAFREQGTKASLGTDTGVPGNEGYQEWVKSGKRLERLEDDKNDSDSDDDGDSSGTLAEHHFAQPVVAEGTLQYSNGDVYKGDVLNGNIRHSSGTHVCSNGDTYTGGWRLDERHGMGTLKFQSGASYSGEWENDLANGTGTYIYNNGSRYEGEWERGCRHGWGELQTQDGDRYEGEWAHDQIHGQGCWMYADGSSYTGGHEKGQRTHGSFVSADGSLEYEGSYKDCLRSGHGTCIVKGLFRFKGQWHKDCRHGHGTCIYVDGSMYEGQWAKDKREGYGKLTNPATGFCHEGNWRNDMPHGQGNCTYDDGSKYIGQWKMGQRCSMGAMKYRDGTKYQGQWKQDMPHGHGIKFFANGGKYDGEWAEGKRHGQGTMQFDDGVVFKGQWENDQWVQSEADPSFCSMSGAGLQAAIAGVPASFIIQAADENGNQRLSGGDYFQVHLERQVLTPGRQADAASNAEVAVDARGTSRILPGHHADSHVDGPRIHASVIDMDDGTYKVEYVLETAGAWLVHVTTGEDSDPISSSPACINVVAGPVHARSSTVSGTGCRHACVGVETSFLVEARDTFGNVCTLCQLPQDLPLAAELSDSFGPITVHVDVLGEGRYCCRYTALRTGFLRLFVTSNGQHIKGSPFSVQVVSTQVDQEPAPNSAFGESVVDRSSWWEKIGRQLYIQVDGSADGWDEAEKADYESTLEDQFILTNPSVPVIERLEDVWKISKLQQWRKKIGRG